MKGIIRWIQVNPDTNEFNYELGQKEFNTEEQSMRDTIVNLLLHEWEDFGISDGDCMVIREDRTEDWWDE